MVPVKNCRRVRRTRPRPHRLSDRPVPSIGHPAGGASVRRRTPRTREVVQGAPRAIATRKPPSSSVNNPPTFGIDQFRYLCLPCGPRPSAVHRFGPKDRFPAQGGVRGGWETIFLFLKPIKNLGQKRSFPPLAPRKRIAPFPRQRRVLPSESGNGELLLSPEGTAAISPAF